MAPDGSPFEGCLIILVEEGVADIGSAVDRDDLGVLCKNGVQKKVHTAE